MGPNLLCLVGIFEQLYIYFFIFKYLVMSSNVIYFPITHYFYNHLSFEKNALAKEKKKKLHSQWKCKCSFRQSYFEFHLCAIWYYITRLKGIVTHFKEISKKETDKAIFRSWRRNVINVIIYIFSPSPVNTMLKQYKFTVILGGGGC